MEVPQLKWRLQASSSPCFLRNAIRILGLIFPHGWKAVGRCHGYEVRLNIIVEFITDPSRSETWHKSFKRYG